MRQKRNVILNLDKELVDKTRDLGFNLSKTFENHLKHLVNGFSNIYTEKNGENSGSEREWWGCPDLNRGLESPSLQA